MKRHLICVLGALVLTVPPAFAATYVWNGSASNRFSDAANWSGGNPASDSRAELVFPAAAARKTLTNDLPGLTVQAISFTGSGYTIGGQPIRLASATVGDTSTGPTTISCDLILHGNATFATVGDFHEGLILSGSISGTGDVMKAGNGPVIFGGFTPNTYSGTTRVAGGELRLAKHHVVTAVPGPLAIDAEVVALAAEQIANEAPVTITSEGVLRLPHDEIIGPLTLERGATISMSAARSAPILYTGAL
ncbi:MAG TPA: hypothetical protein VEU30_09545, partial [Thermoanaerobaculia bacterium]|nr:hypothetical protein [Thermoanaerobaculia bacterium]